MSLIPQAILPHVAATAVDGDAAHRVISTDHYKTAINEIKQWQGYAPTPLVTLSGIALRCGVDKIYYKDEGPRFGIASFKALGGAYAALRVLQREISSQLKRRVELQQIREGEYREACANITLVSATDGNHGRSLAWGCQRFGSPCRIYIHAEVSEERARVMRDFGADVVRIDGDYDESVKMAQSEAEKNGWFVVSDTSWPGYSEPPRDVMAGYGVMVEEISSLLNQAPTHVFLQGGVGGLAAGVAAALRQTWGKDSPRVIVVEPELAACLFASAKNGELTPVAIESETIMAGLSCGEPSPLAWEILVEEADDYLLIPDSLVAPTVRLLAKPPLGDAAIEAGESAVAGLAALLAARDDTALSQALQLDHTSRVLLIGSEGVTDAEIFSKIMSGESAL